MHNCGSLNAAKLEVGLTEIVTSFKTNIANIYYTGNRKPLELSATDYFCTF